MNRDVCEHFVPVDLPCAKCEKPPTLREAAQQALEAMEFFRDTAMCSADTDTANEAITALRAALAEEALQRLTDVQQEMERNFCPRCGKRTNDIHTCTPPQAEPEGDALTAAYMLGRHDGKRKPLTDVEIERLAWETYLLAEGIWADDSREDLMAFARAIERAHGIGEQQ